MTGWPSARDIAQSRKMRPPLFGLGLARAAQREFGKSGQCALGATEKRCQVKPARSCARAVPVAYHAAIGQPTSSPQHICHASCRSAPPCLPLGRVARPSHRSRHWPPGIDRKKQPVARVPAFSASRRQRRCHDHIPYRHGLTQDAVFISTKSPQNPAMGACACPRARSCAHNDLRGDCHGRTGCP